MTAERTLDGTQATQLDWATCPAFIETQFPVIKLSAESYNERKAVAGQTLTGLGKWWGRKPLVLVRALILGLLLPATDDPRADRDVFLKLMTMDEDGLLRRRENLPVKIVWDLATPSERHEHLVSVVGKPRWRPGVGTDTKESLQNRAFLRMSYADRLKHAKRPEEVDGPGAEAWAAINRYLGSSAHSLPDLVRQLGERRFGHTPRVGDVFCGGGSIPFEAARIGCDAWASDLNPVAALLTWGALNIVGGGQETVDRVKAAQRRVLDKVQRQVDEWGIERNELGWIADAYLYCNEVRDPISGWTVPVSGSWVIAEKTNVVARLVPRPEERSFDIDVVENVSDADVEQVRGSPQKGIPGEATWRDGVCSPVDRDGRWLEQSERQVASSSQLRGSSGLRLWENEDLVPRPEDVFQERLYCIRWIDPANGARYYRSPTDHDLDRERRVLRLLRERFVTWQAAGYIPDRRIEPGSETSRPQRERGWSHWHHLFTPRQLLLNGLYSEHISGEPSLESTALLLLLGRVADANSKLSRWKASQGGGIGGAINVFYNQALNTFPNWATRTTTTVRSLELDTKPTLVSRWNLDLVDARMVENVADIWITDPGYADAIQYDELSEFFLAWYDHWLPTLNPGWYSDSKRALAVSGTGESFRLAMVDCYRTMARQMPHNGSQVVMFTHQDAEVWADLALVLWAAGLRVAAAWTIATETGASAVREGNYVQGTVCLVLRKRTGNLRGDMGDLFPDVQGEVEHQLEAMTALDDKDDPNFGDADYQLAAYAAALRVLTTYATIEDIDVERELRRTYGKGERSPLVPLIERAVKLASDYLVPDGLDRTTWRRLGPDERLYLKGVEAEAAGETKEGIYQEFARGFGVADYRDLLADRRANQVRLRSPSEFGTRILQPGQLGFPGSLLRLLLFAIHTTATNVDQDSRPARQYLRQELQDYWNQRQSMVYLLRFLGQKPKPETTMPHWANDVKAARLLQASLEADSM